jgi:hypothetical protein
MTREQRTQRINTLTRELASLLQQESGAPRPAVRLISGGEMPPWVRAWLLEQIRASRESSMAH